MTEDQSAEELVAQLRGQVAATRKSRMDAQRIAATSPLLRTALERASRDRSSGATNETDDLHEEIEHLRDDIAHEVRRVDRVRALFDRADTAYPDLPQRHRLINDLNREGRWRAGLAALAGWQELRLDLPAAEELV